MLPLDCTPAQKQHNLLPLEKSRWRRLPASQVLYLTCRMTTKFNGRCNTAPTTSTTLCEAYPIQGFQNAEHFLKTFASHETVFPGPTQLYDPTDDPEPGTEMRFGGTEERTMDPPKQSMRAYAYSSSTRVLPSGVSLELGRRALLLRLSIKDKEWY